MILVSVKVTTCTSEALEALVAINLTEVKNSFPGRGGETVFSSLLQPLISNEERIMAEILK